MNNLSARLRHLWTDESGQAMVLVAVAMTMLVGFAALVIDIGQAHYEQSRVQAAADASALAAALEIGGPCSSVANCSAMQTAAQQALVENGMTGSTLATQCGSSAATGITLMVNNGPCALGSNDPNSGNSDYVETVVTEVEPTYLAKALGINSMKISARAEAKIGNSQFCVDVQDPGSVAFDDSGSSVLNAPTCGIDINSSANNGLTISGSATIDANAVEVHGPKDSTSGNIKFPGAQPAFGAPSLIDPLNWLNSQAPSTSPCTPGDTNTVQISATTNTTLSPGVYCGGIRISGSSPVTFNPGTYVITGSTGLSVSGSSRLTGTGVTFYFSQGSLVMSGSSTVTLVAPTTGTYAGVLIFQSPSDATPMTISGSSSSAYQGAIYLPCNPSATNCANAGLTISGGGNNAAYTILDTYKLNMSGSVDFNVGSDYSSLPNGSPAKGTSVLVE